MGGKPAPTGVDLYSRFALAGALCCAITHGAMTPIDVVKTRIQLDPVVYNKGMFGTFRQIVQTEGAGALLTGFGPTVFGYFMGGGLKFGGYELFKKIIVENVGMETSQNNRMTVYLAASALAEFFADIALCPLEATRIRLVSQPTFANGLFSGFSRIAREEGLGGFYAGFGPILFKQVPYNMAKFSTMEIVLETILSFVGKPKSELSSTEATAYNLGSGLIAGFAAATISQPADTLLSKINKTQGRSGREHCGPSHQVLARPWCQGSLHWPHDASCHGRYDDRPPVRYLWPDQECPWRDWLGRDRQDREALNSGIVSELAPALILQK